MEQLTVVRARPGQVLAMAGALALMLAICAAFLPVWGAVVAALLALLVVLLMLFLNDSSLPPTAGMALA